MAVRFRESDGLLFQDGPLRLASRIPLSSIPFANPNPSTPSQMFGQLGILLPKSDAHIPKTPILLAIHGNVSWADSGIRPIVVFPSSIIAACFILILAMWLLAFGTMPASFYRACFPQLWSAV